MPNHSIVDPTLMGKRYARLNVRQLIPRGDAIMLEVPPSHGEEQWFTAVIYHMGNVSPVEGGITFGDCLNVGERVCFPGVTGGEGAYLFVPHGNLISQSAYEGNPKPQCTYTFTGQPVQCTMGITNTMDVDAMVIVYCRDRKIGD